MNHCIYILLAFAACTDSGAPAGPLPTIPTTPMDPGECRDEAPAVDPLQWKRVDAYEADLLGGLALGADGCLELGTERCADVHRAALGGNDPFRNGQYEPIAEPLATTPVALERVALGACAERARLDAEGPAEVFTALDLDADVDPTSPGVRETGAALYRRLLARDAEEAELDALAAIAEGGLPARDYAVASCFAIATTTESALF